MSEEKDTKSTSNSRRKALKTIGVGGVLAGSIPSSWTKPVVKSVILPAHAQTSQPEPECSSSGPCSSGMNVSILAAVVTGGGALRVVGDVVMPAYGSNPSCYPGTTDTTSMASTSVLCEVIDNGVVLDSGGRDSAGFDCSAGAGCLLSCSVLVGSGNNTLASGDCVTLRMTFNGTCVCSDVATVT